MKSSACSASVPYEAIVLASKGDVEAITVVLDHYESYIAALSTRTFYDENRLPHLCLDFEMRRRLETKLITRILHFNAESIT